MPTEKLYESIVIEIQDFSNVNIMFEHVFNHCNNVADVNIKSHKINLYKDDEFIGEKKTYLLSINLKDYVTDWDKTQLIFTLGRLNAL